MLHMADEVALNVAISVVESMTRCSYVLLGQNPSVSKREEVAGLPIRTPTEDAHIVHRQDVVRHI